MRLGSGEFVEVVNIPESKGSEENALFEVGCCHAEKLPFTRVPRDRGVVNLDYISRS